ncbi:diacylglycerol kinase family protein [Candidatus Woesebacteria bacterium]|nr:diacylglycerol kinase family protein [Candidatus Woesebacteria bacterium]
MSKTNPTLVSFGYAFSGLKAALKKEPNIRIHLVLALLAIILAFFLNFNPTEWIILAFTISFVLILELINTTLETLVNIVSPEIKDEAKVAKDISAAAVLVGALLSVVVAGFLFLPKIF